MPITSHYSLCISEILHLLRSQPIIDFAFVHSNFVNDFQASQPFSFLSSHTAGTLFGEEYFAQKYKFQKGKYFPYFRKAGCSTMNKHLQSLDELIQGQYVACISIYRGQHLGKYWICHISIVWCESRDLQQDFNCSNVQT